MGYGLDVYDVLDYIVFTRIHTYTQCTSITQRRHIYLLNKAQHRHLYMSTYYIVDNSTSSYISNKGENVLEVDGSQG